MISSESSILSSKIQNRFQDAITKFLEEAHNSVTANSIVQHLTKDGSASRYDSDNRNTVIELLANDVESETGVRANLMFRSSSHLHDCLQSLIDVYLDTIDGVYYPSENA
jgi:hypothetical protein